MKSFSILLFHFSTSQPQLPDPSFVSSTLAHQTKSLKDHGDAGIIFNFPITYGVRAFYHFEIIVSAFRLIKINIKSRKMYNKKGKKLIWIPLLQ